MLGLLVLAVTSALAAAGEVPISVPPVPVEGRSEVRDNLGQYSVQYQTATGIKFQEQGALVRSADAKGRVLVQQGSYSYTSPEGVPVSVAYTADTRGFLPVGDVIPKPVPVPEVPVVPVVPEVQHPEIQIVPEIQHPFVPVQADVAQPISNQQPQPVAV